MGHVQEQWVRTTRGSGKVLGKLRALLTGSPWQQSYHRQWWLSTRAMVPHPHLHHSNCLARSGDISGLGRVLLTSGGKKPGIRPNILQSAGQSPTAVTGLAHDDGSVGWRRPAPALGFTAHLINATLYGGSHPAFQRRQSRLREVQ